MNKFLCLSITHRLKEKGFTFELPIIYDGRTYHHSIEPRISQVLDWLRKKKIYIVPTFCVDQNDNGYWDFRIINLIDGTLIYDEIKNRYNTYELATIAGIEYVIDSDLI